MSFEKIEREIEALRLLGLDPTVYHLMLNVVRACSNCDCYAIRGGNGQKKVTKALTALREHCDDN